jgi:hypothetical protein
MIKTPIRAVSWHGPFIDDADGARIASADSIATRDRITACVNACAGMADSLLTFGAFKSTWETYQAQMERLIGCDDKVGGLASATALERKRAQREKVQLSTALKAAARLALMLPNGHTQEYDTWALGRSWAQRDAMQTILREIATLEGKSTFGNDWMGALS